MLKGVIKKRAYEDIVEQIRGLIKKRKLKRGDQLPTERELSETFKVSRATIREAIFFLEAMNLLNRRQGDGTYVIASSEEALRAREERCPFFEDHESSHSRLVESAQPLPLCGIHIIPGRFLGNPLSPSLKDICSRPDQIVIPFLYVKTLDGLFMGELRFVNAFTDQCVVSVCQRHEPASDGNLIPFKSFWIPGIRTIFMMRVGNFAGQTKKGNTASFAPQERMAFRP